MRVYCSKVWLNIHYCYYYYKLDNQILLISLTVYKVLITF